jgi:hypothetical protein
MRLRSTLARQICSILAGIGVPRGSDKCRSLSALNREHGSDPRSLANAIAKSAVRVDGELSDVNLFVLDDTFNGCAGL